jgi:heme-degrading monooxygenase HmoA
MYARVITVQYQPGKLDEGEHLYRESVVPEARRLRGFQGIMALVDRSSGKAISISLWQTEADLQASAPNSANAQAQLGKFTSLWASAPTIETYEVVVRE